MTVGHILTLYSFNVMFIINLSHLYNELFMKSRHHLHNIITYSFLIFEYSSLFMQWVYLLLDILAQFSCEQKDIFPNFSESFFFFFFLGGGENRLNSFHNCCSFPCIVFNYVLFVFIHISLSCIMY